MPGDCVPVLGLFTESEERLMASDRRTGLRGRQDFGGSQVGGVEAGRRLSKRAISALVSTQHGERNEHLGGVGDSDTGAFGSLHGRKRKELGHGEGRKCIEIAATAQSVLHGVLSVTIRELAVYATVPIGLIGWERGAAPQTGFSRLGNVSGL